VSERAREKQSELAAEQMNVLSIGSVTAAAAVLLLLNSLQLMLC